MLALISCGGGSSDLEAAVLSADACEAPQGKRCWYVDSDAPDGGDGTFAKPYNSFEEVAGYMEGNDYRMGKLRGGDYLYVKGRFLASRHNELNNNITIHLARGIQSGTPSQPTVIKSYNGTPQAVFDGEYRMSNLIQIRGFGSDPIKGMRIENVHVTRANGRGIWIAELVEHCEVVGIKVTEGKGDGNNGTGGGILFSMADSVHKFVIRDSEFSGNHRQRFGGAYNVGAISILSEPSAKDGSIIRIFDNTMDDEDIGIRHKHSGNITTEAFGNRISNTKMAFHLRGKKNKIYRNIIQDSEIVVFFDAGNQNSDTETEFFNNTILNSPVLMHTGTGNTNYKRLINVHHNIFSLPDRDSRGEGILLLGRYSQNIYPLEEWTSAVNLFDLGGSERNFMEHRGNKYSFDAAMSLLSDSTSVEDDAEFVNAEEGNFSLQDGAPLAAGAVQ